MSFDEYRPLPGSPVASVFALVVRTARETCELPDPPAGDLLLGPLLVRAHRTIVVGDTGHGKTTLALQMVAATVTGREFLGYDGAGNARGLIVDLEQGLKSVKRTIREAALEDSELVDYVRVPDGLALDRDGDHLAEFDRVLTAGNYAVVSLDPFYKAAADMDRNDEQAVVALMRQLDALRARHGFALILPAHPRKDIAGRDGARKLTLHDVAGSGAIVRGAEVVIGLERLAHGYARLRILKDRDGDLPVGEAWPLVFTRGSGFRLDPKEEVAQEDLEERIVALAEQGKVATANEWAADLGVRKQRAQEVLARLADNGGPLELAIGAEGRSANARCYRKRTAPTLWDQSGAVGGSPVDSDTAPLPPTGSRDLSGRGQSDDPLTAPGAVDENGKSHEPWPADDPPQPRPPLRFAVEESRDTIARLRSTAAVAEQIGGDGWTEYGADLRWAAFRLDVLIGGLS